MATPNDAVTSDLVHRLDRLPWARFHTMLVLALGVGWTLDSFEVNIIGSVFGMLKDEWHFNAVQGSWAVSIWVFGILIGALLFGYMADRMGRKRLFLMTLLMYALFSVATIFSWDYSSFLFFRFMTALAVGGEYSAVTATMGEFIPKKYRGKTDALILSCFPLGAILSSVVALIVLNQLPPTLGWRLGFGFGALLAFAVVWVRRVIPESPRWLIQHGRSDEAQTIVKTVEAQIEREHNIKLQAVTETESIFRAHRGFGSHVSELFGRYFARTALAGALNFSQAAVVYGVLTLMALIVLPLLKVPAADMPIYYFYGNAAALLGGVVSAMLLDSQGRRSTMFFGYALTVAAIGVVYLAASTQAMVLGYCLIQFGVTWAYIAAYVVSSEILPTRLRASGLGVAVAVGRLGAFFAPLLITQVFANTKDPTTALIVLFVLAIPGPIAALWWWMRGPETRHQSLERGAGEAAAVPA